MAIACGAIWGLIESLVHFLYLSLLLAPGIGYAIGEVVSLSVNRKHGTGLAIVGGAAVVISYLVSLLFSILFHWGLSFGLFNIILALVALALGIFVAVTRLR
jgi:uncharacterized membrane protein